MNPESALNTLKTALEKLAEAGIDYMITGSFASNLYGVPRTTFDADIVIEADRFSLERFLQMIESGFYASPEAANEALQCETIFNIIHLETGLKIDNIHPTRLHLGAGLGTHTE